MLASGFDISLGITLENATLIQWKYLERRLVELTSLHSSRVEERESDVWEDKQAATTAVGGDNGLVGADSVNQAGRDNLEDTDDTRRRKEIERKEKADRVVVSLEVCLDLTSPHLGESSGFKASLGCLPLLQRGSLLSTSQEKGQMRDDIVEIHDSVRFSFLNSFSFSKI